MSAVDDTQPCSEVTPVIAGTFAIYEDGHGGFVLVTDTEHGTDRKHIPSTFVKLALRGGLGRFLG
jgi:hypothetical protein